MCIRDRLYALFFGMLPFPGFDHILVQLLTTPRGWALILTGSAIGGLFAAFAMAISLFSIPMLLERRVDALTALGTSFAITTQNLRSVLPWGVIVTLGFALSAATGLLGLIVIFPLLGQDVYKRQPVGRTPALMSWARQRWMSQTEADIMVRGRLRSGPAPLPNGQRPRPRAFLRPPRWPP